MSTQVGAIHVDIGARTRELEAGLSRAQREFRSFGADMERSLERINANMTKTADQLNKVGRNLTTRVTLPLIAAGVASVKFASDMAATHDLLNDTFREGSAAARDFGNEMADAMGRSRLQMEGFLSSTQGILAPLLEQRDLAAEMSKSVSALAVDLASFYNVADNTALNALQSGLLGITQPLRQFGVVVNEATLEQEAMRLKLGRSTAELTEQEKVLLRYSLIMRQTTDAQGDAIRTIGEFDNQLKALTADVSNLAVEIGQELLPYAYAMVSWTRDAIAGFRDLSPEAKDLALRIGVMGSLAGPALVVLSTSLRMAGQGAAFFSSRLGQTVGLLGVAVASVIALERMAQRLGENFEVAGGIAETILRNMPGAREILQIQDAIGAIDFSGIDIGSIMEELGFGDVFSNLAELGDAFKGLEFDPDKATEESLQRLQGLYADFAATIPDLINAGLGRAADEAGDGANEVVDRIAQAFARFETDTRVEAAMLDIWRQLGVLDRGAGESIDDYLLSSLEWQVDAAKEQVERADRLMRTVIAEGADEASDAYQEAFREVQRAQENLSSAELELKIKVDDQEAERAAKAAAEEFGKRFAAVGDRFWAEFLGEDAFGVVSRTAIERSIADALGEGTSQVRQLEQQIQAAKDAIWGYERLEFGEGSVEIQDHLEKIKDLSAELRVALYTETMDGIRQGLDDALGIEFEAAELFASLTGAEFDAPAHQWRAVEGAIQAVIRAGLEHKRTAEEIREEVEGIVDEWSHLWKLGGPGDPMAAIRADFEQQIGIEALIGRVTMPDFDPVQHEINALSQAIAASVREFDGLTDQAVEWIADLEALRRVQRQQAMAVDLGNASLRGFVEGLGSANRAVSEFVRMIKYDAEEGFKFDTAPLVQMGISTLMWAFGEGYRQELREARTFAAPDPYGAGGLAAARASQLGLEGGIPALERAVRDAQGFVDHMAGQWWNPSQQHNASEALRVAREELASAQQALSAFDFRPFLGIDASSIASAVEQGFDMADMRNLGQSLEDIVRNALIRAWTTSGEMIRLQGQFGNLLDGVVTDYMETGIVGDLGDLQVVIAAMEERGEAFADVLKELGLATDDLTHKFGAMSQNLPTGFRVESLRFESTSGIPGLATGGYVPATPGGQIVRLGEGGEGEWALPDSKMAALLGGGRGGPLVHIDKVYAQDGTDLGRKLDAELRRRGLRDSGSPVGGLRRL